MPEHEGLLVTLASGFTQYAYAFAAQDADLLEENDRAAASGERARAKRLYVRARDYGMRALEVAAPGFGATLREDPEAALAMLDVDEIPVNMRERASGESKLRGMKAIRLVVTVIGTLLALEGIRRVIKSRREKRRKRWF